MTQQVERATRALRRIEEERRQHDSFDYILCTIDPVPVGRQSMKPRAWLGSQRAIDLDISSTPEDNNFCWT
eukprot:CAMPEP_0194772272 /NCGR_PEP_ID=MMETSP0323_2-20130528/51566_1 /TAXON_ID=2866 ORGANISM="Crypthecodinium cohnii, Strain Seligo" /NCGR_SAMPLE_ID=MMETSP0323_2 /ASSEMBLY_ACC=CAM_ASM_000346 /LENGTH=70 /DNA_ID=CAMNT_0039706745 /DNA_START=38 /DNA_END=246 /DNA_ORIENTATION=-